MRTSQVSCFVVISVLSMAACSTHDDSNEKLSVGATPAPAQSAPLIRAAADRVEVTSLSVDADDAVVRSDDAPFKWVETSRGDLDQIPHAPAVANDGRALPLCKDDPRRPDGPTDEALARAGWLLIDEAQTAGTARVTKVAQGLDGQCRPVQVSLFAFRDNRFMASVLATPDARIGNVRLVDDSSLSLTYDQYKVDDPACCPSLHGSQDFKMTSAPFIAAAAGTTSIATAAPSVQAAQAPASADFLADATTSASEVSPCSNANGGQGCDELATPRTCPPLPSDYRQRGEDKTTTQEQRARVADHFLCETSTDFVLAQSLQKRGFTLAVSDSTGAVAHLRQAKSAHDYKGLFGSSIPQYEMIPVTVNSLLSAGVTVTVSHNGKPHDDFIRPEGGVIHFRQSANDPLPGYTLSSQGSVDSMRALATFSGPPLPHMVLGTPGNGRAPWTSSTSPSAIFAIAPCVEDRQTSFGSWPQLKPSKDGKGWQAKISLHSHCPLRIVPVNSPEMLVTVNGGVNAKPVLQCTYGVDATGACIEFSAYFGAAFGASNPFTEISRAETNVRQQADLGNISAEEGASKVAQMRKDFDEKASRALNELDEHFVDIIGAAKAEQIDVCDQDQEKFSSGEAVSAALCKPVRGGASLTQDPMMAANKANAPLSPSRSDCPAPPANVEATLDSTQSTQADRHAYLVSQLCKRFTPDVRLSPLLAARGYTLRMVDKSGVVDAANKAVATGDTSMAFSQPLLPTYRQINSRLQEMEYQVNPWYFVLHNGGKHDVIGAKTKMVGEAHVGNVTLATLAIEALCDKNADAHSIEVPSVSGGQPLEDGSGWQLGASHSRTCPQFVLALPPQGLKLGPQGQFCSYGSDSPGAPCRDSGQLYDVVRHAQPDADPATIASYFDTAFTRFEEEFVKTYGVPAHD